ncbi:MAG: GNAT family N-acetyltransferase [Deltaproteobacteria bacterium]|nr:GNAT family N-acetyltransferase [Deltaproteobacteria bacterium]
MTDFGQVIAKQTQSKDDASFVAEIKGAIVGYLISYILSGSFGIEKSAWVAMLGVDPKFMGQGIGEMLAGEALKYYRAQGIKDIYTSVLWDSTDLLSFFKTLGFSRSNFINLHKRLE